MKQECNSGKFNLKTDLLAEWPVTVDWYTNMAVVHK